MSSQVHSLLLLFVLPATYKKNRIVPQILNKTRHTGIKINFRSTFLAALAAPFRMHIDEFFLDSVSKL